MKLIFSLILLILFSCSTSKPLTSNFSKKKKYKKTEPIKEEAFVSLKSSKDIPVHLINIKHSLSDVKFLIPAKKYEEPIYIQLWEVQVLAVSDEERAKTELQNLKKAFNLDARIINSNRIFKVRVGGSETRVEMDQLVNDLKKKGYSAAWVVKDEKMAPMFKEDALYYTLQVGVFSSNLSAINFKKELSSSYSEPIIIKFINGLYKVFIGKEEKRISLEELKLRLNNKSAWITQQKM